MSKLLFYDAERGIYTFRRYEKDKVRYQHAPDTEVTDAIFKQNQASKEAESASHLPKRNVPTIQMAAKIPITLWLLWESMGITQDANELRRAIERHQELKTSTKKLI